MHKSLVSLLPTCLLHINKVTSPRLRICAQSTSGTALGRLIKSSCSMLPSGRPRAVRRDSPMQADKSHSRGCWYSPLSACVIKAFLYQLQHVSMLSQPQQQGEQQIRQSVTYKQRSSIQSWTQDTSTDRGLQGRAQPYGKQENLSIQAQK